MREDTTKVSPQSGVVSSTQFKTRCLEPDEEYLISEVVSAYRQSLEVCMDPPVKKDGPSFGDLVNIAELSVRRVIDMAKDKICISTNLNE
jgi:hypothetical protein